MTELTIAIPDDSFIFLNKSKLELAKEIQLMAAIKLYEMKRISAGAAAAIANIPKPVFLARLAEFSIPTFDLTEEELQEDLKNA